MKQCWYFVFTKKCIYNFAIY